MRLHEYYFGNLTKGGRALDRGSALFEKLIADFGSFENWEKDFKTTGTIRGVGWVVLYLDSMTDYVFNTWINEHDVGHLAGATPLLIMDVFEHAYLTDYDPRRADYIEAFFRAIDWVVVRKRFDRAVQLSHVQ